MITAYFQGGPLDGQTKPITTTTFEAIHEEKYQLDITDLDVEVVIIYRLRYSAYTRRDGSLVKNEKGQTILLFEGMTKMQRKYPKELIQAPVAIESERLSQYFLYDHLPPHLQGTSKQFHDLMYWIVQEIPQQPERAAGLRKLLEAKDCIVRAKLTAGY